MPDILIVEDSSTQAEKLASILEDSGYSPRVARDGESALGLLAQVPADLVISDIVMPGLSGYELCRRIKAEPATALTPVMLLSTLSEPMDIIRGLECGADNFLTKPYRADHLVGRVRNILANRAIRGGRGIEILFLGKTFTITSERQQILDLLISTFEDTVRANRELEKSRSDLAAAKSAIERYAATLEARVEERTGDLRRINATLEAEVAMRRETEQELLRTRSFLTLVVENLPGMVFVKDAEEFRYTLLNSGGEKLLGCKREAIIGKLDADLFPADEAATFVASDRTALAAGRAFNGEYHVTTQDDRVRQVKVAKIPVFDHEGAARFILGFVEDITEHRELENQLRHAQKMDAIGRLTGGIAHDFNNILGIIIGSFDLLAERTRGDAEATELAWEGLKSAERGAELTRRMLAFARQQPLERHRVDVNAIVRDMALMLRRTLGERITVATALAPTLWSALSDPGQIENVILNLAVNARDAMPQGGRILIETANFTLDAGYAALTGDVACGDYVMLSVTDSGTGMPPQVLERAFDPFFTTKEPGSGTGLGLSMVYGFAKQCRGHAKIYSEVGHGTTVKLYLPREDGDAAVPVRPAEDEVPVPGGNGETVLLVEDDSQLRGIAMRMLSELGYRAIEATDEPSALQRLREADAAGSRIALLFTDLVLPAGGNGHQLAAQARRALPDLKVLFTSGYSEEFVRRGAWSNSVDKLLTKPYRKHDLGVKLRSLLNS